MSDNALHLLQNASSHLQQHSNHKYELKEDRDILTTLDCYRQDTVTLPLTAGNSSSPSFIDASHLPPEAIIESIAFIIRGMGKNTPFPVPSRRNSIVYDSYQERFALQKKDKGKVRFSRPKYEITLEVLSIIYWLLRKNIYITKRDLYYMDVERFKKQSVTDRVLDEICSMIPCRRQNLNVIASEKGLVAGCLIYFENGERIDCKLGSGGTSIPRLLDCVQIGTSNALFILLVEKDSIFTRLVQAKFYTRFPCIVITAKGEPDVATRQFLRQLKMKLKLPVFGLFDCNPYGLHIMSVYRYGSKNMAYDNANLVVPNIKWLGVRPTDLDMFKIPEQCQLKIKGKKVEKLRNMLAEKFMQDNVEWSNEVELMVEKGRGVEIEALYAFGFEFLYETYLPFKLQNQDFV